MNKLLEAKNFLSWEQLQFTVEDGVTSITGFNFDDGTPEGSGKSAIPNAICWGLYGKLPKDANVDDVIREGAESCEVRVPVGSCTVVRKRKPNDLFIISDGQEIKGKDARETQKLIENLVGMTFDTYCQTVYFAQNYAKKFILSNQEEKGKILSEIQLLNDFDTARKKAHEQLKDVNTRLLVASKDAERFATLLKEKEASVNYNLVLIDRFMKEKEEKVVRLATKLERIQSEIKSEKTSLKALKKSLKKGDGNVEELELAKSELRETIEQLNKKLLEKKVKSSSLNEAREERARASMQFKRVESDLIKTDTRIEKLSKALENPGKATCPTCGAAMDPSKSSHVAEMKEELEELQGRRKELEEDWERYNKKKNSNIPSNEDLKEEIAALVKEIGDCREAVDEIDDKIIEAKSQGQKVTSLIAAIERLEKEGKAIQEEMEEEAEKQPTHLVKQLEKATEEVEEVKAGQSRVAKNVEELTQKQVRLETLKEGYREVKAYVFQSVLEELTRKANVYLKELFEQDVKIKFKNEDMKIATEVTIDGQLRPLGLYSGGQFRRISLAVDLALSDITTARKGSSLNMRILDEYFKDLSEVSMEKALRLLERLKGTTLLIEHNSVFQSIVDKTFHVELKDGVSRHAA